jgi:hypothetical protein
MADDLRFILLRYLLGDSLILLKKLQVRARMARARFGFQLTGIPGVRPQQFNLGLRQVMAVD